MRLIFLLISCFISTAVFAVSIPQGSSYDSRIQHMSYNQDNVTKINAKIGFITTVIFADDEIVEKAVTGFDLGWKIIIYNNKLFITPTPVEQASLDDGEQPLELTKFAPIPAEWRTNLFVSTNKRSYSLDLNLVEANNNFAYIVNYSYPEQDKDRQEQQYIATKLKVGQHLRNCDFFVKTGKNSDNIVPDFVYDDGAMTYLGFSTIKNFPSAFLLNETKEQTVNYSVQQQGEFKILVIHHLSEKLILRYGKQVVGILNKSYGKYLKPYSTTASVEIKRVEKNDG